MTKLESADYLIAHNGNCKGIYCTPKCCLYYRIYASIGSITNKIKLEKAIEYKKEMENECIKFI